MDLKTNLKMDKTFYYHSKLNPRFTVAGEFKGANLILAISLCSERDQFVKKLGRIRSSGRLKSKKAKVIEVGDIQRKPQTFCNWAMTLTSGKTKKQLIKEFGL